MSVKRNRSLIALVVVAALCLLMPPGATAGEGTVSILGMAWTSSPAPALVLSASGPLKFEVTNPEAGVMIVELPLAVPAETLPPVSEPQAGLKNAALSVVEEGGKRFARLRVEFDPASHATVNALPAGLEIVIGAGENPAAPAQERDLSDLLPVADASGVSVLMAATGELHGKTFTLDNPPRVVVDLPGVVNRVTRRVHPVGAAGVQRVRVAQFATSPEPIVRVVVDLDHSMPYKLETTARGAVLRVGAEPAVAAAEAAPAAAPAKTGEVTPAPTPVEPVAAKAEGSTPAVPPPEPKAAPAAAKAETTAAAPEPAAAKPARAAAKQPEPVKIIDEPIATAEAAKPAPAPEAPSAPANQTASAPAQPSTSAITAPPETQPAAAAASEPAAREASPADSPWTTTQAAMAEQAAPVTTIAGQTKEVESQEKHFTGEPISLELKDADIKDVLRSFAKITGLNIVVDPDVSGSVTVQLDNVPWDQALDIILRINGLSYVVENNVLRVARISKLTQEKQQLAEYKRQEEAARPMRTVTKALSYARAEAVRTVLTTGNFILSERGSVVVDSRTNQLIIRDSADRIPGILALIDNLDQPNPEVMIEARIVETTRTFSQALGVNWGFTALGDAAHGTTTGLKFPNSYSVTGQSNLGVANNGFISMTFADILNAFNLDFTLSAAEADGLVKIVSSPKVMAQNNEKAHIQSGVQIPIQTVANNTVTVQYIDATLSLDVTPQITAEGTVMLDIDLKKREPLAGVNLQSGQNVPISTRDARTRVMVRDGGTTVIGGIYKFTDNDQSNGLPVLDKLPLVGWLFKNHQASAEHDELLIFITPRIVKY
jgi:type IV pilus assembly protein PilQ